MKRLKPTTLIMAMITIIFLLIAPQVLGRVDAGNVYKQWLNGEQLQWKGVMKLWHVVDWNTGGTSGTTYLKNRALEFEKNHGGIFIEVEGMTQEEADQRIAAGETPDMITFTTGYTPALNLSEISMPTQIKPQLKTSAQLDGKNRAVPFMMGGYVMLANRTLFAQNGIDLPLDGEWDLETLQEAVADFTALQENNGEIFAIGYENSQWGLAQASMLTYLEGTVATAGNSILTEDALQAFCDGKLAIYFGNQGCLNNVKSAAMEKGLSYEIYSMGNYTDLVQYIAITEGENREKQKIEEKFILSLLSEKNQKKLADLRVFSVIEGDIHDNELSEVEEAYDVPRVPNSFQWGDAHAEIAQLTARALVEPEAVEEARNRLLDLSPERK